MPKRRPSRHLPGHPPRDPERRELVKGGLLAAAAALGFLPRCSDPDDPQGMPPGGGTSGGGAGQAGAPQEPTDGAPSGTQDSGEQTRQQPSGAEQDGTPTQDTDGSANPGAGPSDPGMAPIPGAIPRRMLGSTGVSLPVLGLGTSRLGQRGTYPTGEDWDSMLEIFAAAIDMGIEYVDTGAVYGRAEEALGEVLKDRRDKVFLVTKLHTDSFDQAQRDFERSLMRMGTDHVDLLHLHNTGSRNLDVALSDNGSWPCILEQKAKGLTRFVGITGHNNPPNLMRMLETGEVDVMMALMNFVDHSTYGFSDFVRAAAVERNIGVMAMKVFGGTESEPGPGGGLANSYAAEPHPSNMELAFDDNVLPDCMRFVKTLPGVTGMVIGVNHLWELERNIAWAMETEPFTDEEFDAVVKLGQTVAPMWAGRYG